MEPTFLKFLVVPWRFHSRFRRFLLILKGSSASSVILAVPTLPNRPARFTIWKTDRFSIEYLRP